MVIKNKGINEIILHVGLHKTGTSSIQRTLSSTENNNILENKGYFYPISWYPNHSIPVYSAFSDNPEQYQMNIINRYSFADIKEINKQNLEKLKVEVSNSRNSKLIISGEDISTLTLNNLKVLKNYLMSLSSNDLKIKVMIYVRNPISWSVSLFQQLIKSGDTYEKSLNSIKFVLKNNFRNSIDKFRHVFGQDNLDVFSFEEAIGNKHGLIGHFLSEIGFDHNEISNFNIVRANESASLIAIDIISFINKKIPMIINGKLNEKRTYGDITPLLGIKGPKFDIPFNFKKELFEICQDDIKWLKENYKIDYSNLPNKTQINFELTEQTINVLKREIYPHLSLSLRNVVFEYLKEKIR